MGSVDDIMQLCRLCLVKDQVNIPIFDESSDIRQTFLKINSCLPVKVSRDDNLPKKICDGCSYKLDMLYIFRNTSVDSEKQLLSWLNQAGLGSLPQTSVKEALTKPEIMVKQETFETTDPRIDENPDIGVDAHQEMNIEDQHQELGVDTHSYILQQQKLPYQQEFAFGEPSGSTAGLISEEPVAKRAKRVSSLKKHVPLETEEDDLDNAMQITKAEEEDSDEVDQPDYNEQPSTSADDQPGPSGVGKGTIEAPSKIKAEENDEELMVQTTRVLRYKTVEIKPHRNRGPKKNKIWTCKKCLSEHPTRRALMEHKKTHKGDEQEQQTYKYDSNLEVYVCNTCSAEFQDKEEAQEHITKNHIETYSCDDCQMKFSNPYNFACHMQQHDERQMYNCPLCSYGTPRRTCILTHINRMHYHKFYYYCKTCGKGFNDSVRFKEHDNEHLGVKPFVCVVCTKSFVYSRYLFLHQLRYHTVGIEGQLLKNQCSVCLRVFSKNNTLDKHMISRHTNTMGRPREKRHLCDICGKGFATKDKMRIHYRVHTGIKPYTCQYCNKGFIKRDYLIMHERVHTGEKPYVCRFCGKCFNQGAPLRIHVRGHTGERPYICQFCNTGFISKGSLNMHQKICMGGNN